jgi:DNA helicase HerA-like ATPase
MTTVGFVDAIAKLAKVDLFDRDPKTRQVQTGLFVGRPFYLDYDKISLLVADAWKNRAGGLPQGAFLLAYYENEDEVAEAILLRVLRPTPLPTDRDVISSMVEYYKDDLKTTGKESQLDQYTRYEFSFSGLECRVLGTFYRERGSKARFGADLENFYSSHNYSVIKPNSTVLEYIVNFREGTDLAGKATDIQIGRVRYSSSRRFQLQEKEVPVYVSPEDFLGKRTALFGMTRTGKSNTVKKIIQATVGMSGKAKGDLGTAKGGNPEDALPFDEAGFPRYAVGQIIFDINGEYANPNLQDAGTAIYELFKDDVLRYSTIDKAGFKVMKINFYHDVEAGFELVRSHLENEAGDYVASFRSVDFSQPEDKTDRSAITRYDRKVAAYVCCLYRAGFPVPKGFKVKFTGNEKLNELVQEGGGIDPSKGIPLEQATDWFKVIWDEYESNEFFPKYRKEKGHEWADEDLQAILKFLTRKRKAGGAPDASGYLKLRDLKGLHTETVDKPFSEEILAQLRAGKIVIVDLSQGVPEVQRLYSERICRQIFADAMLRFVENRPNNFVEFYFEEAHNLFPKKDDKDLSQIYNRLAKEGAKLNLGLIYATQEVSSISANILKNTQNWFIAHLNNEEETKEIKKYYDFGDFTEGLVRFSASSDRGFVSMKTYSNPFVVPVQIDRFPVNIEQ